MGYGETKPPEPPDPQPPITFEQPTADGKIWTAVFWKDTAERCIKSFAQGIAVGFTLVGVGEAPSNISPILDALIVGGLMALASLLTSLGSAPFGSKGTASLAKVVVPAPQPVPPPFNPPSASLNPPPDKGRHAKP